MAARYYGADSESGDHVDDLSEDALFKPISELNDTDNTCVVIQPDQDDPAWFAPVAGLDEGGYEIVRRDTTRREHHVTTENDIGRIADDLTPWLGDRTFCNRPRWLGFFESDTRWRDDIRLESGQLDLKSPVSLSVIFPFNTSHLAEHGWRRCR